MDLTADRMSEAEVALRLAFHLLALPTTGGEADVALDGAQISVGGTEIFAVARFLDFHGWKQTEQKGKNPWQGVYSRERRLLRIHSRSGIGDVVCRVGARTIRAECKKGPLLGKRGNPEYAGLREALGQLLTVEAVSESDVLTVAVPDSAKFRQLADAWSARPLMKKLGLRIALVARDGGVRGLEDISSTAD